MSPSGPVFFDTNVVLYLLDDGPKADRAEALLAGGGVISVQVLNEALVNCRRKAGMSWDEAGEFLDGIRQVCRVLDLTVEIHDIGRAVAARDGVSVYDAMIVAAALGAGCGILYTEDMQDGRRIDPGLRIVNPFADLDTDPGPDSGPDSGPNPNTDPGTGPGSGPTAGANVPGRPKTS